MADDYDDPASPAATRIGRAETPDGGHRARPDRHRGGLQDRPPDAQPRRLLQDGRSVRTHGVSFVSVTQQFNTTTSMGRLMLNVLLSFAQFEREVTGERIRDKIAAAKRKGDVDGRRPALGYDVDNRLLVINEAEAAVVRRIFEEMLTIGSDPDRRQPDRCRHHDQGLDDAGGQTRSGTRIDKKYLHKLLRNRIYLGSCRTKGTGTPALTRRSSTGALGQGSRGAGQGWARPVGGNQDPVAHRRLAARSAVRPLGRSGCTRPTRARTGASTTTTCPSRKAGSGRRARATSACPRRRSRGGGGPDPHGADQPGIHRRGGAPHPAQRGQIDEATTVMAMGRLNDVWDQLFPVERHRIANLMIERIDLVHVGEVQGIKVKWRELGWDALIGEVRPEGHRRGTGGGRSLMDEPLETFVPLTFRRRGARRVAADERHVHDVTLLGVARGFYWQHLVDTGVMKSGSDIARAEGLHPSVPNELMRLTLLAPDILELQLMAGRQPRRMNLIWFQRNPCRWIGRRNARSLKRFEEDA